MCNLTGLWCHEWGPSLCSGKGEGEHCHGLWEHLCVAQWCTAEQSCESWAAQLPSLPLPPSPCKISCRHLCFLISFSLIRTPINSNSFSTISTFPRLIYENMADFHHIIQNKDLKEPLKKINPQCFWQFSGGEVEDSCSEMKKEWRQREDKRLFSHNFLASSFLRLIGFWYLQTCE